MPAVEIYENVGRYNHYGEPGENSFSFCNGTIDICLITSCCDYWDTRVSSKEIKHFRGQKYTRRELIDMSGKNILYVVIKDHSPKESGSITLFSKKNFCKVTYEHEHNGYYPASFSYYTDLVSTGKEEEEE